MSQGNLNYHFKTRSQILEALYFELVEKMNVQMAEVQQFSFLSTLYHSAGTSMQIFFDYRFLLRDIYVLFRENEVIKEHYLELQEVRAQQFKALFQMMIVDGVMRVEELEGEYDRLYERINILGDNWINPLELFRSSSSDHVKYYQDLLFEGIYPYLTAKGKSEYLEIMPS